MSRTKVSMEVEGSASVVIHVVEGTAMVRQFQWRPGADAPAVARHPVPPSPGQARSAGHLAGDQGGMAEAHGQYQEMLQEGAHAFGNFVLEWSIGFGAPLDENGKPTVEQPDRQRLLNALMAQSGRAVITYIRSCGGLARAVRSILLPDGGTPDQEKWATDLVGNMVQVSSVSNPFLAETWELYDHDPNRPRDVPVWLAGGA